MPPQNGSSAAVASPDIQFVGALASYPIAKTVPSTHFLRKLLGWHPFLLHWHPAGGLTRLRINYCSKKQAMYEIPYPICTRGDILYLTSQSVQSYVCTSLPYVFFSMCIFLRVYVHTCAYSIPRSIWPPIIWPSPCPRTLLDPKPPGNFTPRWNLKHNNFLWD